MNKNRKKTREDELYDLFSTGILFITLIIFVMTQNAKISLGFLFFGILGVITWLIWYRKWSRKRLLESGIDIIDEMSGVEFEKFLLEHFKHMGYKGQLTSITDDFGADLVLQKDGRKIVVQAKRWKKLVGIEAIQQVIGAINHYGAHKAMVITNNSFTENAYELAMSNGVELWDRHKLIDILNKYNEKENARNIHSFHEESGEELNNSINSPKYCKKCGKLMKLRDSKYGKFWGCTAYPKCNYKESYFNAITSANKALTQV